MLELLLDLHQTIEKARKVEILKRTTLERLKFVSQECKGSGVLECIVSNKEKLYHSLKYMQDEIQLDFTYITSSHHLLEVAQVRLA